MLDKFIAFIGVTVLLFCIFMGCVEVFMGATKWYQLQTETQFVATRMSQYGGYTQTADNDLRTFLAAKNFDPSKLQVNVTPNDVTGPSNAALYGQTVTVTMSYPFSFLVGWGSLLPVNFPLTTYASAVSTFVPNMAPGGSPVIVTYVQPAF